MFPLADDNSQRRSLLVVTLALIALNEGAYDGFRSIDLILGFASGL
jgi:hypothetical protein